MSSLLNFPESYEFQCSNETRLRIFRYPNITTIEISNIDYRNQVIDENSIDLNGKRISITIGELSDSKQKSKKHCGILTNYEEDVGIQIVYEDKKFQELVKSLEDSPNIKNLFIGLDISEKEAKKKKSNDFTTYLVDNFKIVKKIF